MMIPVRIRLLHVELRFLRIGFPPQEADDLTSPPGIACGL